MGAPLGFGRRVQPVERLAAELAWKAHTLRWEAHRAAEAMLELASVALLAVDQQLPQGGIAPRPLPTHVNFSPWTSAETALRA